MKLTTKLKKYKDMGFTQHQLDIIRYGFERNLSKKQVDVYAKLEYSPEQMIQICYGLIGGLSNKKIATFSNPSFSPEQMVIILKGFTKYNLSITQVSYYANPCLSVEQMEEILLGFIQGLSCRKIKNFNDPTLDVKEMRKIRCVYTKENIMKLYYE